MGSTGRVSSIRFTTLLAWSFVGIYFFLESVGLMLQVFVDSYFAGVELSGHILESVALTVWVIVGALLVSRKPKHPIGWILCIIPIVVALDHFAYGYAFYGFIANPGTLPGVEAMIVWQYLQGRALGILGITLLFLLFPTGRPLSHHWGILAWIAVGAMAIYIPVTILAPNPVGHFPFPTDILSVSTAARTFLAPLRWVMIIVTILCALAATYSLLLRLYLARGIERQQLKWFVFAAAIFIPGTILIVIGGNQQSTGFDWIFLLGIMLTLVAITGMAVASAVAILRYRLWDIDILIRRTLVYGLLTIALALVYFGSVMLLQQAFRTLTGQDSPVAESDQYQSYGQRASKAQYASVRVSYRKITLTVWAVSWFHKDLCIGGQTIAVERIYLIRQEADV